MDSSTNPSMNGTPHGNNQSYSFLDTIQPFATTDPLQNGEDYSRYFDPALFETTTIGHGFAQQPQSIPPTYDSNASRQSNSPSLPQYNSPQPSFQHTQYSQQPLFDTRQMSQPAYDPRFYPRPSASPVGFDGGYNYRSPLAFNNQNYNPQHMNMPQGQTPAPTANYPPRQQPGSPYVNIGPHLSQLSQIQNADMMQYGTFQEQNHHPSNPYVDPSLLTANQMINPNTANTNFQHSSYMTPSYFKAGSTVDPMSLQGVQPLQPMPPALSQVSQTGMAVQPKLEKTTKPKGLKDPHAPKKPTSKTKKNASSSDKGEGQVSRSGSESDSDAELSIEDEEPEMTPAPLTVSAPTDERGKALYNAVQAVWSPRNKSAPPEKIRNGIASFGDTVRGLRDAWKSRNDSLRKAELPDSPTAADAALLKDEVARYRQVMESVMARSLLYGHPAIVKRLGENQFTLSALYSFMLDRFQAGDFDSPLVNAILKFVVGFETLDSEMLEMTKLSKILQRFTKKATNDIKPLAQSILDHAAAVSAKKAASKSEKPASPRVVGSPADGVRKEMVTGMKRPREGEAASHPAPKKTVKVIPQSSKPLALQNAERRKALEAAAKAVKPGDRAAPGDKTATAGPVTGATGKAKVAVAAPPKSTVFSSLMSASKKPGTSLAARAASAAKDKSTPATVSSATVPLARRESARKELPPRDTGSASVAKTASSFLGLLADMEKKPEKEVKKDTEIPNETEEDRSRRLRKEARRKLRVSWKADAELVETREFTHDPDEEVGDGDSLRRHAGDTGREGEALKLHKDMEEMDDDEDEDSFEELEPYAPPSEVDFSVFNEVPGDLDANSLKVGGSVKPDSPSSDAQNKREQDAVMAVYSSKAERPPTPKEPDDNDEGDFEPAEPETPFGEPGEKTRQREKEYVARQTRALPIANVMPTRTDLAAQIQALSSGPAPQQQPGAISAELQRALSMLGQPNQATPPPQAAPAPTVNFQALLQSVQQVTQQWQGQPSQPQYQAPAAAPTVPANLSALLASMQQTAHGQTPIVPVQAGGNAAPFLGPGDEASRKHGRTDSNDYDNDNEHGRKGGNKKKKGASAGDQSRPYNYKTQVCSFWEQGKCLKGDTCTYRHGDE